MNCRPMAWLSAALAMAAAPNLARAEGTDPGKPTAATRADEAAERGKPAAMGATDTNANANANANAPVGADPQGVAAMPGKGTAATRSDEAAERGKGSAMGTSDARHNADNAARPADADADRTAGISRSTAATQADEAAERGKDSAMGASDARHNAKKKHHHGRVTQDHGDGAIK